MRQSSGIFPALVALLVCVPGVAQEPSATNHELQWRSWIARLEIAGATSHAAVREVLQEADRILELGRLDETERLIALVESHSSAWAAVPESPEARTEIQLRRGQLLARRCRTTEAKAGLENLETTLLTSRADLLADWEDELGSLAVRSGDFTNAILRHARAVAERRTRSTDHRLKRSLNLLGTAQLSAGQHVTARRSFEEALRVSQRLNDERGQALARMNLAVCLRGAGRLREAHDKLLAVLETVRRGGHADLQIDAHANLAAVLQAVGRFKQARTNAELAVKLQEQMPDCRSAARLHNTLGVLCQESGDFKRADNELNLALQLARTSGDRVAELSARHNLGRLALGLNQPTNAIPIFQGLAVERREIGDLAGEADALANLGAACFIANRSQEGRTAMEQALNLRRRLEDNIGVASLLIGLGAYEAKAGRATNAMELFVQAHGLAAQADARALQGSAFNNLGLMQTSLGRMAEAHSAYAQALMFRTEAGDPVGEGVTLYNLMTLAEAAGRFEEAIFYGKQSVARFQRVRANVFWLSVEAQQSFKAYCQRAYRRLAGVLIELGRLPEAQQIIGLLKEEEYFEHVRGGPSAANSEPAWTRAQADWRARYDQISANIVKLSERDAELLGKGAAASDEERRELAALKSDLVVARTAFVNMLDDVRRDAAKTAPAKSVQLGDLRAIQSTLKSLGRDAALLHFVAGEEKLHVILTTPLIQRAHSTAVTAPELNRDVFAFREALRNPRKDPRRLAEKLYRWLLEPVAEDLKQLKQARVKTLLVSLDGALRYVPVAALHNGRKYVAEEFRVVMFAQAANYQLEARPTNSWSVAAMGLTQKVEAFDPLPYVREELEGIVSRPGGGGGVLPGVILLDDDFVPPRFSQALLAGHPVVHIASHFVFDPAEVANSYLLLGRRERLTLLDLQTQDVSFGGVDLLTLSACETAVSAARPGSGGEVEGFAVEAQRLGAKGVLATLWPVADRSTSQLMQRFYTEHERARGTSKAEALQRAQIALLKGQLKQMGDPVIVAVRGVRPDEEESAEAEFLPDPTAPFAHPFYWAPFVLIGNWL